MRDKITGKEIAMITLIALIIVVVFWPKIHKTAEASAPAAKAITIANPLVSNDQPKDKVGWAKAENTSSGVWIRASVKVGFTNDEKGGVK